jgi:alkylation response protein AidB-like acyl-CoA dehydrogenase
MDVANSVGVIVFFTSVFISAFYQLSALRWTILLGIVLFSLTSLDLLPPLFAGIVWVCFLIAALFANLSSFRQRYLIASVLPLLKKKLPPISATEREAIEAGNTWWEKQLFSGSPRWQDLFTIPKPTLALEEQYFLNNQVDELCAQLDDWQILFEERNLSQSVWNYLKKEKFFGMVIPKKYGGLGFSALAHSTVVTKIASRSISAAVNTMVPNSLGPAELLLHYGTEEQKAHYLPRLASGDDIPCFALTAPEAGSDAGSIPDSGVVCMGMHEGKQTLGVRLSWDKRYITLAPVATVLGIAFRLYDPEHLLGQQEDIGITLCLIPASHPGVEIGNRHYPLLLAFMNGPTRGNDVFIPLDWIIGGSKMAGHGWRMLMECLSIGRAISLPALATASAKVVYRNTGAYARLRRQFNSPLSAFEGIEEALGYIAGYTYILEASRIMTAGAVDLKIRPSTASAIAKYHMTEMSRQVISHAMDVHAGHTIQVGPRNFLANLYLASPISITVEGANILTRNLIIFGQGAIRCHPYLLKEIELISAKNPDVAALDKVLLGHVGFYVSNLLRNLAYGLTGGKFIFATEKNKRIKKHQRQLTRMSAALALFADTSLILLGGGLKRKERLSARLGDILSQLYLASAVLKYYHDNHQSTADVDYVCWSLQECLRKIQCACNEIVNNFPYRYIGKLLNWIVFPFGQAYSPPSDKLHKKIVSSMLEPTVLRERLTQYCFTSQQHTDIGNRLNHVLTQMDSIDPLWRKIQQAVKDGIIPASKFDTNERIHMAHQAGIVSEDEAVKLKEFDVLRSEIIKVNEFSFDLAEVLA